MNQMQSELDTEFGGVAGTKVQILGINQTGFESGNPNITNARTIPWLQDTADQLVWNSWAITFRDVVILDAENKPLAVYNVTVNNLGDPAKYAELKQILKDAAATLP